MLPPRGPMKLPGPPLQLPLVFWGAPNTVHGPGLPLAPGADGQLSITYVPACALLAITGPSKAAIEAAAIAQRLSWTVGPCAPCAVRREHSSSGYRSGIDVHIDGVAGARRVGVAARAAGGQRDPELVGGRFDGGVEAVAVVKPALVIRHDLIEDPPTPAFLNLHIQSHPLRRIGSTGDRARPANRAPVAGVVRGDLQLDLRADRDRRDRARRRPRIIAIGGIRELQAAVRARRHRVGERAIQPGLHSAVDRRARRAANRGGDDSGVTDRNRAAVQHTLHRDRPAIRDHRNPTLTVDLETKFHPRTRITIGDMRTRAAARARDC